MVSCLFFGTLTIPACFTVASAAGDPGVAARALACIADVLGCMAKGEGGLRSGPAANKAWEPAFQHLERGNVSEGVKELAKERKKWLSRYWVGYQSTARWVERRMLFVVAHIFSACLGGCFPHGMWVLLQGLVVCECFQAVNAV